MLNVERGERWENRLARPMFALSLLFLVLVAVVIHAWQSFDEITPDDPAARAVLAAMLALWPLFLIESLVRFLLRGRRRRTAKALGWSLLVGLVPPLRMGAHSSVRPGRMWLPWLGWRELDFDLQKTLEDIFSAPMLFMALMILPVLGVEYFWAESLEGNAALRTVLRVSSGVIWLAFAVELVIRTSAAEKKVGYLFQHWVDVAVVLLPTLRFMPFLRLLRATRVMRLETLARLIKYYRLYGLAGKGWRGLVVLRLVQRLFSRSVEARISRLQAELESKRTEMQELEREMDYYRRKIAALERERSRDDKVKK